MKNIYLELELFLDPAITDAVALKTHIEKKISEWNKMVNLSPKYKDRVRLAKKHLEQGLSNLSGQAESARKEKLQALRNDIKKAARVGGINDLKLKKLKLIHRDFFTEETISAECGGATGASAAPQKPVFTPPKRPDSLVSAKTISFKDMKEIAEDLNRIDGTPKDLYELLQVSPSANTANVYKKAQEKSAYALKMPKTNAQADSLNRLAGKCINFFKDEQNRKNYDIALKRFPFDSFCEMDLQWNIDKENGIPWDIYQESIHHTVQQGFTQGEAEWLVYNYYCEVNKCPDPIPEAEKPASARSSPAAGQKVDVGEYVDKTFKSIVKNSGQFSGWAQNWFNKAKTSQPSAPAGPIRKTQSVLPQPSDFKKIEGLRKKFLKQKNPSLDYLNSLFRELDSMVVQYQTAPAKMLEGIKSFRAEIGEMLGDLVYAEGDFVFALQCYRSVLDCIPQHAKAGSRCRMIDSVKDDLYRQVRLAFAEKNYLVCKQRIKELKQKFTGDPETDDFIRKTEKEIRDVPISQEYVQRLVHENRWYALANLLEDTDQSGYIDVLRKAKGRLESMGKSLDIIRRNLRRGKFDRVGQQLKQIRKYVADYPEYNTFKEEAKQFHAYLRSLDSEFKDLIDQKQLIKGENKLRQFLAENPKYRLGLAGHAQIFANGVTYFQNGLRFWLFAILGCILFVMVVVVSGGLQNHTGNTRLGIVFAIGFGFLFINVAYSGLLQLLYVATKTSYQPSGFGLIGTSVLFVLSAVAGCFAFVPDVVETMVQKMARPDSLTAESDRETFTFLLLCIPYFAFFYFLHVYIFSFFNRCMDDGKEPPLFLPLPLTAVFTVSLLLAEHYTSEPGLLFFGVFAVLWWTMTAATAYIHFRWLRKEMSVVSRADISDYLQRNKLLRQYGETDFGQPLLLTDWYQKALDLTQQQDSALRIKNSS